MSVATWHTGDVFAEMAKIPDGSVDLIVTSPPFLALRSYLAADHPDKAKEIGSEATPAAFVTTLLALTREWRRILAPHGSICVELGDTYAGSGGGGGDYLPGGWKEGQQDFAGSGAAELLDRMRASNAAHARAKNAQRSAWPPDKSLCLLPTLYPASLAYGRNLLDPDDRIDPWRIRNLIVWHRPNPPVGALGDKVRPSTSYVTIACMRRDRWFDLDAERTDLLHFPIALPRRLIRLMCPMHVCRQCGEPRRRITDAFTLNAYAASDRPQTVKAVALARQHGLTDDHIRAVRAFGIRDVGKAEAISTATNSPDVERLAAEAKDVLGGYFREFVMSTNAVTASNWSDCGHDDYRRGRVLDPFAGSGTTLAAATEQGRDAIGIDLDDRNLDLARQRIGLFLEEPA